MSRRKIPENPLPAVGVALQIAPIYKSAAMFERRHRILREALGMIFELGYDGFNFRELARRSEVAPRTLYNAFGSRENIVASAILWYSNLFRDRVLYADPAHTLRGQLERTIKVHSRNLQIRSYTSAIMAVYNSHRSAPSIRRAIRTLANDDFRPFVDQIALNGDLMEHVAPKRYTEYITSLVYCKLSEWCLKEIIDDDLIDGIAEALLVATLAFTRGAACKEAQEWLNHVRAHTPEWQRLRTASEVPVAPQRTRRPDSKTRKASASSSKVTSQA